MKKTLGIIRFAIFVEAGLAAILYLLYLPHRYFGNCDTALETVSTESFYDILCPVPNFAESPHPIFYVVVDVLMATAIVYVLLAVYLYFFNKRK